VALIAVSGRRLHGALQQLEEWGVPRPDGLISSVGCEIHYARGRGTLLRDQVWLRHIDFRWQPDRVREVLDRLPGLSMQPGEEQGPYKVSYFVDPEKAPGERELRRRLRREDLQVSVLLSHEMFLDVVPIRASKGQALRYLALRWGLPLEHFLVAGAAGSDLDMLAGDTLAVVVSGADEQLRRLRGSPRVHFASGEFAAGVLEGIEHYRFLDPDVDPGQVAHEEDGNEPEEEAGAGAA
jgi:sucrose-phosphate synthase